MNYDTLIRKLARSEYWQTLYSTAKEIGTIRLFDNDSNYSSLQSLFLYWLRVYNLLYTELAQKEWKFLDEDVINNDIRCDAFLHWRNIEKEKQLFTHKQNEKVNKLKFKNSGKVSTFDIDFQ